MIDGERMSLKTANGHVQAIKQLSRWAWLDGRARDYALAPVRSYNAAKDRRLVRRALSDGELTALLHVAHESGPVLGMAGPNRAMLYALAVGTGLRASELASLRPESFRLDDAPPVVVVACAYTKNRKEARQPLPPSLVEPLRQWLAGKEASREVFKLPDKTAKMMRADLADKATALRMVPPLDARRAGAEARCGSVDWSVSNRHTRALTGSYGHNAERTGGLGESANETPGMARIADPGTSFDGGGRGIRTLNLRVMNPPL